jgi:hypothetical protein
MQPLDSRLRDGLAVVADSAGPVGFTAESVTGKVRRRRRRSVVAAGAGVAALTLGVVAVTGWFVSGSRNGGPVMADPSRAPADAGPLTGAATPGSPSTVYMCGERLVLPDVANSREGLTLSVSAAKSGGNVGPDVTVTFTAGTAVHVTASPPTLFEVLYLDGGIIVGGGPMLNSPGDVTSQGIDAVGMGFDVGPGHPSVQQPGRRDTLCQSLSWSKVWSAAHRYEVVVIQGRVEKVGGAQLTLGIPLPLDAPLLVGRVAFPQ